MAKFRACICSQYEVKVVCHGTKNDWRVISELFTQMLGLGCDYDVIPHCKRAKQDIEDLVSWDIDWLKVDGCGGFE